MAPTMAIASRSNSNSNSSSSGSSNSIYFGQREWIWVSNTNINIQVVSKCRFLHTKVCQGKAVSSIKARTTHKYKAVALKEVTKTKN